MNRDDSGTPPLGRGGLRRDSLVDQAAARFRAEVVSGRWPVGGRIPTEPELVDLAGVGRNTVREAVQSLVHAGLLRREQGRGTFVISDSELAGPLGRQLAGGSRRDYLELRLALDRTAAALAAGRRTAEDVARLRALRDRRAAAWAPDGDPDDRAPADLALHRAVVEAGHNPLYLSLYASVLDVFALHMRDDETGDADPAAREHHDLVEAVVAGDAGAAAAAVDRIVEPLLRDA